MRLELALVVTALAAPAAAAPVLTFSSDPHPGIHRETWTDSSIPAVIRLIRVDLTSSEIGVFATKQADRGQTTSGYAGEISAQVAINGDSFAVAGYVPTGLAMGDSVVWSNTADDATSAVFDFHHDGPITVAEIIPPEKVVAVGDLPPYTEGVVSGRPLLVRSGAVETQFDCDDPVTLACQRGPRSAVALSADGNTLWLVAVDGWQSSSLGLTAAELANFLLDTIGVDMAMALDGGSSSTLVVDGTLISNPSDGVERTVANHLALKYQMLPSGEMYGLVCKQSISDCVGNPDVYIGNAQVTLDDGTVQDSSTTNGSYDFLTVTPRLACVTVKKSGYYTKTQCTQIMSNMRNYNSVALEPCPAGGCPKMVDAGVDAAGELDDASTGVPGDGHRPDGGNGLVGGGGGGCCGAGRDRPDVALCVLVAWLLMRRRVTTA